MLKVVKGKKNNLTSAGCLQIYKIHDLTNRKYHDLDENQLDCRCINATLGISAVSVLLPSNIKSLCVLQSPDKRQCGAPFSL